VLRAPSNGSLRAQLSPSFVRQQARFAGESGWLRWLGAPATQSRQRTAQPKSIRASVGGLDSAGPEGRPPVLVEPLLGDRGRRPRRLGRGHSSPRRANGRGTWGERVRVGARWWGSWGDVTRGDRVRLNASLTLFFSLRDTATQAAARLTSLTMRNGRTV